MVVYPKYKIVFATTDYKASLEVNAFNLKWESEAIESQGYTIIQIVRVK